MAKIMEVLIDGENFRHQIADILMSKKLINDKNDYFQFDLKNFFVGALGSQNINIRYYTTKIKQPRFKIPIKLQRIIAKIMVSKRKWLAQLANHNISVVKAGYLRVRESNMCVHCGKKTLVLQEKGVDVRVASDLLMLSKPKKSIALVSSDSDLTPAIQAANKKGVKLVYICYGKNLNRSVAALSDKIITYKDSDVIKFFKGSNG